MLHSMRQGMFSHLTDFVTEWLTDKHDLIGIEIGSYAGESAEMFVNSGAFKTLYCIDPWIPDYDPSDSTCDDGMLLAEDAFDKRFAGSPVAVKIKKMSSEAAILFEDASIDFIYIDGNHQYDYVKQDLQLYVPKIKPGGIIAGHDYGGPTTPGVTRAVDEYFGKPPIKRYLDYSWIQLK